MHGYWMQIKPSFGSEYENEEAHKWILYNFIGLKSEEQILKATVPRVFTKERVSNKETNKQSTNTTKLSEKENVRSNVKHFKLVLRIF